MMIDMHTHIFNQEMWASYQKRAGKNKIEKVIVIPWFNKSIADEPDTEDLLKFTDTDERLFALGSIDMDGDIKKQLAYHESLFKSKRILGIKLYPGYQYFYPSEKKVYAVAELCAKYNKLLVFHSGDVYGPESDPQLKYSNPIHIDEIAMKFPKTKIVISHFGFPYLLETANIMMKNANVFADISGNIDAYTTSPQDLKKMVHQFTLEFQRIFNIYPKVKAKVMFGTDYCGEHTPLNEVQSYINLIKSLLTSKEQQAVFYNLAQQIYFEDTK